ncbi:hypothetical protein [Glycomyces xiaoerkulensis]|uniref:hypothetical protein n=1 Tax=Glycomyces xiaoerkulensis TaxID=2038139 RepID=UPI000C256CB5|nr:hypothetical protein [Glycomyces xiaoerkulensis]
MKRILQFSAFVVGGYLVVRAAIDPFTRDASDPSTYENDWGGPTLIGAYAVHMGPGIVCAALFVWWLVARSRRRRAAE